MSSVDWPTMAVGGSVGVVAAGLFFVGLALGIRWALHCDMPARALAFSAALRISALLGVGWIVVGQGGPWAGIGYALAFIATRQVAKMLIYLNAPIGTAP